MNIMQQSLDKHTHRHNRKWYENKVKKSACQKNTSKKKKKKKSRVRRKT